MKALSIQQPWAWLIVNGYKDVENRSWATNVRGEIAVHAGKKFDVEGYEWVKDVRPDIEMPAAAAEFAMGGVVGTAEITDCITEPVGDEALWFFGPFGFVMANPSRCALAPLRGQLGFFDVPEDIVSKIRRQRPSSEGK